MKLTIIQPRSFSCARTCTPGVECLFGPILRAIGSGRLKVVSHTTKVDVELRNRDALKAAVEIMNGRVIGEGTHRLFGSNMATGYGFNLPAWRYPLVLGSDNKLAYDDFGGQWGCKDDISILTGKYAIEAGRAAATAQGWVSQDENGALLIFHPSGATISVKSDGTVESNGFVGQGCDVATAIENAIGHQVQRVDHQEYFAERAHVRE